MASGETPEQVGLCPDRVDAAGQTAGIVGGGVIENRDLGDKIVTLPWCRRHNAASRQSSGKENATALL